MDDPVLPDNNRKTLAVEAFGLTELKKGFCGVTQPSDSKRGPKLSVSWGCGWQAARRIRSPTCGGAVDPKSSMDKAVE